jgi:hypothetical protein
MNYTAQKIEPKTTAPLEDIIGWDIPNWSVALDYWRSHTKLDLPSSRALEIGSRFGGISLWAE